MRKFAPSVCERIQIDQIIVIIWTINFGVKYFCLFIEQVTPKQTVYREKFKGYFGITLKFIFEFHVDQKFKKVDLQIPVKRTW